MRYLTWRKATGAVAVGALAAGCLAASAAPTPSPDRIPIAGTYPSWARSAPGVSDSQVTAGSIRVRVYLAPRDPAGLAALTSEVSTPGGARYRHFLSPGQVQAEFGITPDQISAIKSWLTSAGLTVTAVINHVAGGYVAASGPGKFARPRACIAMAWIMSWCCW